jgi:acyl carrier protein
MSTSPSPQILFEWLQNLPTNPAITADTPLIEDGLLDSLAILELVSFLEENFGFTLPLEEFVAENFRTPAEILALTDRLRMSG